MSPIAQPNIQVANPMSTSANKLLIHRLIEEVINTGDVARLPEFVAPGFLDEFREHILAVRRTYPDLHLTIDQQIAEGDLVATCVTMTGTHRGEWPPGAKPTNKPVRMQGVNIDRIREGLIVEHGGAANQMEAFMEIGVLQLAESGPPPHS